MVAFPLVIIVILFQSSFSPLGGQFFPSGTRDVEAPTANKVSAQTRDEAMKHDLEDSQSSDSFDALPSPESKPTWKWDRCWNIDNSLRIELNPGRRKRIYYYRHLAGDFAGSYCSHTEERASWRERNEKCSNDYERDSPTRKRRFFSSELLRRPLPLRSLITGLCQ